MIPRRSVRSRLALFVALLACVLPTLAQTPATGTLEGRVLNFRTGDYIEGARLNIEGTALETSTDSTGAYRLSAVPAGSVRVRAFYTGFPAQTATVAVVAGTTVRHEVDFGAAPGRGTPGGEAVKLDAFVVGESREMAASALAINEQRFAPNIKNVVSTDEFGIIAEGNAAEFIKFLPGVAIESTGGNLRDISINGAPAANVPVTIDGFGIASSNVGDTSLGRSVAMDMVSVNNLSRIEVEYSPTPESQGSALSGTINMVPRSAFERARPVLTYSAYLMARANEYNFDKSAGPRRADSRKIGPGFDFSWVVPVSKRFGFTLSGGTSENFTPEIFSQMLWRPGSGPTNGPANAGGFPVTTPDRPYMTNYTYRDASKDQHRVSGSATLDFRLGPSDRLSLGFQYSYFNLYATNQTISFVINRVPADGFTLTSTRSGTANGDAELQLSNLLRDRYNRTLTPTFTWRHDGRVWKADLGLGFSRSTNANRDIDKGGFNTTNGARRNVAIAFDQMLLVRPGRITVTDLATGQPIDPFSIAGKTINTANAATSAQNDSQDQQRTAYGSVTRDVPFLDGSPLRLKAGFNLREQRRDNRGANATYSFNGPDGLATTDESAAPFLDTVYARRSGAFGFPAIQGISYYSLWERYQAQPAQFTRNANNEYRSTVTVSKNVRELVSAAYLRADAAFLDRRLKIVGGLRGEQTNIEAQGPLNDPTRNFQRDAAGRVVRNAAGVIQLIRPATDALGVSQLTFIERGTRVDKEFLRLFPNVTVSYNVRDNLIARISGFRSVGRPDFNQYSGGITLPNTEDIPSQANRIVVNNAGIKAWSADTLNLRVEYYFAGVGQLSATAWRRDTKDFFGATRFAVTPQFLDLYGLDDTLYGAFDVETQYNVPGTVRMEGSSLNYRQALTFLPAFARGVQVFANASTQRRTGALVGNSGYNFYPRTASWGVSLTRERYSVRFNWNYRSARRGAAVTGAGIPAENFTWIPAQTLLDAQAEWTFWKRTALFVNVRNALGVYTDTQVYNDATPEIARFRNRLDYGVLWTVGVKGTF